MRLSDRALVRLAWVSFGFVAVGLLGGTALLLVYPDDMDDWGVSGSASDIAFILMVTSFPLVGLLITRQQPRNRIGWLLLAIGWAWAWTTPIDLYVGWGLIHDPGSLPGAHAMQAFIAGSWLPPIGLMGIFLILLFPDGRLPSPRWRPLAWLSAAVIVVGYLAITFAPGPLDEVLVPEASNPLGIDALRPLLLGALVVALPLLPLCVLASAWSLVRRFRRAHGDERLQLKWLATAGTFVAVAFVLSMASSLPYALRDESEAFAGWVDFIQTVSILSFVLIPIAIGVAVSRHGLYEIDAIINRALVLGALGVFITGVYVAIVVGIGAAIGNRNPSIALSIVATAVVAVAFQPVRERVQALANRLVYGTRATPYEVLADFASRMAGTYTTTELLPELARVVGEGVGAKRVEVWMTSGSQLEREACWPAGEPPIAPVSVGDGDVPDLPGDRVVPVRHQGDLLGLITVTKATAEPVTPTDDRMLAAVASQAGLVLRNLRLIDDLRSSRERLVTSQDVERRRLERNLHDGAQQSLVSVALLTKMAAARASDEYLRASLTEAAAQLQQAIVELRELARGIHPAILTERGLGPALTSLAERSPVPVQVEYTLSCRPPETVERTLYFVVAEALTNIAKYAAASSATVVVSQAGHTVTVVIADDGVGGADAARGSGLRGLADRVAAVDGSLEVDSPPGGGTRITCRVPVSHGALLQEVP
jgi:signal transduction histidine kinase